MPEHSSVPAIGSIWLHRDKHYRVIVYAVAHAADPAHRWIIGRHIADGDVLRDVPLLRRVFRGDEWDAEMIPEAPRESHARYARAIAS